MTNTVAPKGGSAKNLSSLFSWNKSRQVTPLNCLLEMDISSPRKPPTELMGFDEEGAHLSYTSLQDLLPASNSRPGSPVKGKRDPEAEVEVLDWAGSDRPAIKNRLVEQAARAYLLPTSPQKTPPDQFFARYWAKLTSNDTVTLAAGNHHGCIHGCTHGCLSCLPTLIWVDLTRALHALFGQFRPQTHLLRDRAHNSSSVSTITPSLVK
jgi:hypothetical protein